MATRKPQNDLEAEFKELVDEHREEFAKLYSKLIALSNETGVPFGSHIPDKFKKHFYGADGDDGYDAETKTWREVPAVDLDWAEKVLGNLIDREFWQSSTTRCEMYY